MSAAATNWAYLPVGVSSTSASAARTRAATAGMPRPPVPELAAIVLSNALGRKISETEMGMTPSNLPSDVGLQLPTGWAETIATSTTLWRADVQRRRFLVNAVFTSAALPASALRWLTSPPASAPAASGTRKVGHADIDAIRELTHSYREMDNRLGGGRLRRTGRQTRESDGPLDARQIRETAGQRANVSPSGAGGP